MNIIHKKIELLSTKEFFLNRLEIAAVKIIYHGSFYISVYVKNYTEVLKARKIFLLNKELVIAKIKQEIITNKLHDNVGSLLWNENSCSFYSYEDYQINRRVQEKSHEVNIINDNIKLIYNNEKGYFFDRLELSSDLATDNEKEFYNSYKDKFDFLSSVLPPNSEINLIESCKRLKNIGFDLAKLYFLPPDDINYNIKYVVEKENLIPETKEFYSRNKLAIAQIIIDELLFTKMVEYTQPMIDNVLMQYGFVTSLEYERLQEVVWQKIDLITKRVKQAFPPDELPYSVYLPENHYYKNRPVEILIIYKAYERPKLRDATKKKIRAIFYDILREDDLFQESLFEINIFQRYYSDNARTVLVQFYES